MFGCDVGFTNFPSCSLLRYRHVLMDSYSFPRKKAVDNDHAWLAHCQAQSHVTPAVAFKSSLKGEYFNKLYFPTILGSFILAWGYSNLEGPKKHWRARSQVVVPADGIPGIDKFIQTCQTTDPANRPLSDELFRNE